MKKLFINLSVFILVVFGWLAVGGLASMSAPGSLIISQAEAKGKDKDKDKDDDKDDDKNATCGAKTGICANQAYVTVKGMKSHIDVRSGSGAVSLDVTSPMVDMESKSGDLSVRGLTKTARLKTKTGNVRTKYCVKPQDITGGSLYVEITNVATTGSDADLQFPKGSKAKVQIKKDPAKFKNHLGNCSSCAFKIKGSVKKGYLFISEYTFDPSVPLCKY